MGIILGVMFSFALVRGIHDIHEGDCLTFSQIQNVLELERSDIYEGGECDIDYAPQGEEVQELACGARFKSGEWHRQMVRHKKPGFYWLGAPPCVASVEFASYEHATYGQISEGLECRQEIAPIVKYQQEKLATKKFSVGQGEAYLPNPLWVHREKFGPTDQRTNSRQSCTEAELTSSYVGWGKFEARWSEKECDSNKISLCKQAKLSASQNDKGQTCGLIEKLTDCVADIASVE